MSAPTGFNMPNCFVIPSASGKLSNCVQMKLPSTSTIIFVILISWAILLAVVYAIYWFTNKVSPGVKLNYWIILLILILAGFIVSIVI